MISLKKYKKSCDKSHGHFRKETIAQNIGIVRDCKFFCLHLNKSVDAETQQEFFARIEELMRMSVEILTKIQVIDNLKGELDLETAEPVSLEETCEV